MRKFPVQILKTLIRGYQYLISPLTPPTCRFFPTCSCYALEAVERHGAAKGGYLAARRILKCHPWHKGPMIDPVPASIDWAALIGYNSRNQNDDRSCGCHSHEERKN